MANKGNGDAELPDPPSSSLSCKETTEINKKPEEVDTKQHLDVQKKDTEKGKQHKERHLEETIQEQSSHRNDPESNPDHDATVESVDSSGPKIEQEEESNPDPDTTSENSSKPVENQKVTSSLQDITLLGLPQISQPENVQENEITSSLQDMTFSGLPQESQSEIVAKNEKDTIKELSSQTNDPKSNLGPDTTEEITNSSELQKKLEDMTSSGKPQECQSDIVAQNEKDTIKELSSQTNDPKSNLGPDTTVEITNSSELQKKLEDMTSSGKPQECQSDIVAENEKDTIKELSSQTNDPKSNLGPDTTVEITNSSELQKKLEDMTSSGIPQKSQPDIVAENEKDTIKEPSSQTNDPKSNLGPDTTVKIKNRSELQRKIEEPDTLKSENSTSSEPKEKQKGSVQDGTSSGPPQISQPEREENEKSPLNIQKPKEVKEIEEDKTARYINEENVERDENEVQDQDQNLQSQIIVPGINKTLWIGAIVFLLVAVCALMPSPDSTPPKPNELNEVEVFNQEMKKLETNFPNQRPELWRRSLIHLRRHLKTKNPSEPVSLILTSGYRAEKTLDCLARCLARAFSTAVNSSVLNINGKSKASQDSDQVKLDIDRELKNAFDSKKSAAVIHRFEELPPGSTLIFYRYCDHENAAYKNVFLAFTVMLDAEVEVPSNVSLGRVEEMVQEHIKQKFVSDDKSAMFNQMDVDKLSGLWSRISHLILPVSAEEKIEQQGCGDCDKSF